MKKITSSLILALITAVSFGQSSNNFFIRIIQNNHSIPMKEQVLRVQNKPFKIRFDNFSSEGIYLHASYDNTVFNLDERESVPFQEALDAHVRAESTFNSDQSQFLDKDSYSYFFYDTELDWHRFDKELKPTDKGYIAHKTITSFVELTNNKTTVSVNTIKKPVYLVFFQVKKDKDGKIVETYNFKRFKLIFG